MKQKRPGELGKDLVAIRRELMLGTGATAQESELALFVIWEKARHLQAEIIDSIAATFEIRGVHEITWSPERADENFARFYQGRPVAPYGTFFSDQKGSGAFLLITVVDESPCYEARDTHRGTEVLNARCFDLKHRIRREVGGVMRVHSTDTAAEAERDLLLLLGTSAEDYLRSHPTQWDGTIKQIGRDLSGADGWSSVAELMNVINHGVRYVVVRDFDGLPGELPRELCLVTDNYHEVIRLLNAKPEHRGLPAWGGRFACSVGGAPLTVDVRFPGDDYYEPHFAEGMLQRRQWQPGSFFTPNAADQFQAAAWHMVLRQQGHGLDAWQRLLSQASAVGVELMDHPSGRASAAGSAWAQLLGQDIRPRAPRDPFAYHDYRAAGYRLPALRVRLAGLRRQAWGVWMTVSHALRYAAVSTKQHLARAVPGIRMLWPSYRRLAHGPVTKQPAVEA